MAALKHISPSLVMWLCISIAGLLISSTSASTISTGATLVTANFNDTTTGTEEPTLSTTENPAFNGTTASSETTSSVTSPDVTSSSTPQTTRGPGGSSRGFDAASFFGGIALTVGLGFAVCGIYYYYSRNRKNTYQAM